MQDQAHSAPSASAAGDVDYSDTLFLPKTDFPMRAGLPLKEPELLARWNAIGLYGQPAGGGGGPTGQVRPA